VGLNTLTILLVALGWLTAGLAVAGTCYTVMTGILIGRFFRGDSPPSRTVSLGQSVTILKPLHGAEPRLRQNLEGFFLQDGAAPAQIVFGVQASDDPALDVARTLELERASQDAVIVVDGTTRGQNQKISNIINMMTRSVHPVLVLSDSDIGVPKDYLRRVLAALNQPDVGVVTCPYYGVADVGFWSKVSAMGLSYQFLPNLIAGVSLGMAHPCMGSTIALRRETLDRIGGFDAFCDTLADDYAIGAAVRALGLKSVVAPVLVSHSCTEETFRALIAHELRWARTVKAVDPVGHLGSIVTHPLALALLAAAFFDFSTPALGLVLAAFAARLWLMGRVDRAIGRVLGSWWLSPLRDITSFLVFAGSFFISSVEWRGAKFHVTGDGGLRPV
jgi:ceramide glucosyltransferase